MKYLVNSREMQKYDANTVSHFKVPGLLLMERAAITFVMNSISKRSISQKFLSYAAAEIMVEMVLRSPAFYFWRDILLQLFLLEIKIIARSKTESSRIF